MFVKIGDSCMEPPENCWRAKALGCETAPLREYLSRHKRLAKICGDWRMRPGLAESVPAEADCETDDTPARLRQAAVEGDRQFCL